MITDAKLRTLKYKRLESKGEKNRGQLLANRIPDRDGMYVNVSPAGTITFRYDYRWPPSAAGRRQCITYGQYPTVPLATTTDTQGKVIEGARELHQQALRKIRQGINPMDERREQKLATVAPVDFKAVAERWYERNKAGKSESWARANRRYLEAAYLKIGSRDVRTITARDISNIISPIEADGKPVVAEKMRQAYAMVFDAAADKPEFILKPGENPARVISVKLPDTKHHPHLKINEVADFLKAVDADENEQARLAVRLLYFTLVRKMELCGAKWSELDLDAARWEIPAERMKEKKTHIVPLSTQAIQVFRRLKELANGSEYVFPSVENPKKPIHGDTVNKVFRRAGYAGKASPHGCRSTASTTLNELGYRSDVIERTLSHVEADEVRASYNHADYMLERRKMLQDWANCIDRLCAGLPLVEKADNVIPIHAAA